MRGWRWLFSFENASRRDRFSGMVATGEGWCVLLCVSCMCCASAHIGCYQDYRLWFGP